MKEEVKGERFWIDGRRRVKEEVRRRRRRRRNDEEDGRLFSQFFRSEANGRWVTSDRFP